METDSKINQVLETLRIAGWTEDDIAELLGEISKSAIAKLFADASLYFTEEDLKSIDDCHNQEEADQKINELYRIRVGGDPEQKIQELMEVFATGFLDDYQKSQTSPSS